MVTQIDSKGRKIIHITVGFSGDAEKEMIELFNKKVLDKLNAVK